MSRPDFDSLLKQVDDIDTNYAIHGTLTMDEVEKLEDILSQMLPSLYSGTDETVAKAYEVSANIEKLLKKAGKTEPESESDLDETTCTICGDKYTGTDDEIKTWEDNHLRQKHPEMVRNA